MRVGVWSALALVASTLSGCNAGKIVNGKSTTATASTPSGGTSSPGGSTTPGTTAPTTSATPPALGLLEAPSSAAWMTEDEEVAWINSLGYSVTVADLRASYGRFTPTPVDPNTNVLWSTETDELRNYYRLYKRTGHPGFLTQATSWRDFMVNTYSNWQNGGSNVAEPEHVYLMGLVDWWLDKQDAETLAAIDRLLDFILQKVNTKTFYETRVTARSLQCLCYYKEKIGKRNVDAKIAEILASLASAKTVNGFITMRYAVGVGFTVGGQPNGTDLRTVFPKNTQGGIVKSATTFDLKGQDACASFQDVMLMHALNLASRVQKDMALKGRSLGLAVSWKDHVGTPYWDKAGASHNPTLPANLVPGAGETDMFRFEEKSGPLFATQFAPFSPEAAQKKTLSQNALLRQYNELSKVQPSELGGKPRYYPWQTWEAGYFLTQK